MHHKSSPSQVGIIVYPGSNCEKDCEFVFRKYFNIELTKIWHTETQLSGIRGLIIPGGFSYGDYLRGGHLASLSPSMKAIKQFAKKGGSILGICNGFQILTEMGLLPGTLLKNECGKFICKSIELKVNTDGNSVYQQEYFRNKSLSIPIAHGEGRYYIDSEGLKKIQSNGQIVYRYTNNPNGSVDNIAGVSSAYGKILGLMPHPERAMDKIFSSDDGKVILESFLSSFL